MARGVIGSSVRLGTRHRGVTSVARLVMSEMNAVFACLDPTVNHRPCLPAFESRVGRDTCLRGAVGLGGGCCTVVGEMVEGRRRQRTRGARVESAGWERGSETTSALQTVQATPAPTLFSPSGDPRGLEYVGANATGHLGYGPGV